MSHLVIPRELDDVLCRFEPRWSGDTAKHDPELTCRDCGEVLCDIEDGDDFNVLVLMTLEHTCAPGPPFPDDVTNDPDGRLTGYPARPIGGGR